MSAWIREGSFQCFGCSPAGCAGHTSKLIYQDTADAYTYYIDDEVKISMSLEQKIDLVDMLKSLE